VYLKLRYLLTQCINDGKYNYVEYDEKAYLPNLKYSINVRNIHGPAVLIDYNHKSRLPVDSVHCVRCLSWPPQAANWSTRHRNYGWPDSATLDHVVSNRCDVVPVAHRQYRHHELIGKFQWRLSFSRAEIVLVNRWMPEQQIVYHLLRYFVKTERLTESADNSAGAGTLNNYHIKSLMLWACELKPRSWWTDNLNLVRVCVELLQTLSVWLTDARCPHYFINNCNLLDNSFSVGSVASKLISIDEECLSAWLINNYIRQCAQLCPVHISRSFNDVSTIKKLQNVFSEIIRWRVNTTISDKWAAVGSAEGAIAVDVPHSSLTVRSCVCLMNGLKKIDQRFCVYFSAVELLHVAHKISSNSFSNDLSDILAVPLGNNVFSRPIRTTELNSSELVELLQKSAVENLTTYRQNVARDFGSVVTIVTTDFEALYAYKRGDYQRCLQLSIQNLHRLIYVGCMHDITTLPEFIQLMDDDIVSLTALTLIVNPKCRDRPNGTCVGQLTLSLYLMTQCQLKLYHSVTSLARTLDYIKVAQRRHPRNCTLDHLTLKWIESKVHRTIFQWI